MRGRAGGGNGTGRESGACSAAVETLAVQRISRKNKKGNNDIPAMRKSPGQAGARAAARQTRVRARGWGRGWGRRSRAAASGPRKSRFPRRLPMRGFRDAGGCRGLGFSV